MIKYILDDDEQFEKFEQQLAENKLVSNEQIFKLLAHPKRWSEK